ncbi:MAG: serine hydrolase [Endomicrobium sp.]|jgi:CubicO group peptidase (beta-lactamase class C family)|nr:serine hydrolase [Endomicrobium sp.]
MKKIFAASFILSLFLFLVPLSAKAQTEPKTKTIGEIVADFDDYVQKTKKDWNIPGMAVCLVEGDKIIYKKAFGVRNINSQQPVDVNTLFQIASCSKSFSAVLTAMLVDYGYLKWNDKVIEYLPYFALYDKDASDAMTVEDLLSQNSGLPDHSQHLMTLFGYDKDYILTSMRYIKPEGVFRKKYSYQNNLFLALEKVIEKATEQPFSKVIKKYVFNSLNMKNATVNYQSWLKSKNKVLGHYYKNGLLNEIPANLSYSQWPYVLPAASGINASIDDVSKWLSFIANGAQLYGISLLSKNTFDKLFEKKVYVNSDVSDKNNKNYYCMGWRLSEYGKEKIYWHAGMTDGQGAYVAFLKDKKIGIAVLSNLANGKMCDALAKRFFDAYLNNPQKDWSAIKLKEADDANKKKLISQRFPPDIAVPSLPLEKYVGFYDNILYGSAEVKLENGVLKFSAGDKKTWIKLKHFSANIFDGVAPAGWTLKNPMFSFRVFEHSNVNSLTVETMTDGLDAYFRKIK